MSSSDYDRRDFFKVAGISASAVAMSGLTPLAAAGPTGATTPKRRNILLIHTDSWDGRIMGCMGHPAMARATPNIDALARRGVLFRNAYCNSPICCPSRASMWSGLHTHHCEGWNNHKFANANSIY